MQAKINEHTDMAQKPEMEDALRETEFGSIPKDWKVVELGRDTQQTFYILSPNKRGILV